MGEAWGMRGRRGGRGFRFLEGTRGEAVSTFFEKKVEPKSFSEDRRKSSRFTIENGEIYLRRPTAIVLRVHLIGRGFRFLERKLGKELP